MDNKRFVEQGYDLVTADNPGRLTGLRQDIFAKAKELVGEGSDDPEEFFNNFHNLELRGPDLNNMRVELIRYCSEHMGVGRAVFESFEGSLSQLLGPDVVVQKTTNLVIQQPGDPDVVPTHRDSPLNSPFEIVVWLPLVNVYGTKSMYVLDRAKTKAGLDLLKNPDSGYRDLGHFTEGQGEALEMPFGEALFFWPGLVHSVAVNSEQETRWALNIRYKNLFAPAGAKGQMEFFEVLNLSPLARMALEYEKEAYV